MWQRWLSTVLFPSRGQCSLAGGLSTSAKLQEEMARATLDVTDSELALQLQIEETIDGACLACLANENSHAKELRGSRGDYDLQEDEERTDQLVALITSGLGIHSDTETLAVLREKASPSAPPLRHMSDAALEDWNDAANFFEVECQICMDTRPVTNFLVAEGCHHEFCDNCISQHAEVQVKGGKLHVSCPHKDCPAVFSLAQCSDVLSPRSYEILIKRQTEAAIPEKEKVYCPFPDCSVLMEKPGIESITFVECWECNRGFCIKCVLPWHGDLTCAEYQAERKNAQASGDEKLRKLAEKKKWKRCQQCGQVIELKTGCNHITCRCGHEFCYTCGAGWIRGRPKCRCKLWVEANLIRETV